MPEIRPLKPQDLPALWQLLKPIFRAGDTYALDAGISEAAAVTYWTNEPHRAFVVTKGDKILGSYYIGVNQGGGGAHVCNCGFATAPSAQGMGLARKMLNHAEAEAKQSGFRAMQFNFVVTSNMRAIDIWKRAGFATVGRLPEAFLHPDLGYVDALVMYKSLL